MSSSPDLRARVPGAGPRVGILRGLVAAEGAAPSGAVAVGGTAVRDARAQAEATGFAEGYAAGVAAAEAEVAARAAAFEEGCRRALAALRQAAEDLRRRQAVALDEVADQAAALALEIARAVLQREVAASADPGRDALARALHLVPDEGPVAVRLHPADAARAGDVADLLPGREVVVVPDPSVQPGGCLVQVGATRVDAQLSTALERVAEVLR
jgi:flagellar assembly protein FliH